jgi:hypothetical protein
MRKLILSMSALALTAPVLLTPATPAAAHSKYREWRGSDGRTYCRKSDGTVGLVVGGVAGALVGRAIDTRGDRAVGTLLGAGAGALLGREVQRNRRCR